MWRFVTPPEPFWPPSSWTNINFFLEKQLIKCTYWPLSFSKTKKKFLRLIHSYEVVPFLGRKWPICHEQIFLAQTMIITFMYLLALFIVQNLKNILQQIQLWGCAIFGPKMVHLPKTKIFGNLLISLSSNY